MASDYTVEVQVKRLAETLQVSVRCITNESGKFAFVTKTLDSGGHHVPITPAERAEAVRRVKDGEGRPRSF